MTIIGDIVLDPPANLDNALLRVTLEDVTMEDALSKVLAMSESPLHGRHVQRVPFALEIDSPPPDGSRRYVLRAEVRRAGRLQAGAGDYLSTRAIVWRSTQAARRWEIPLTRLSS